MKKLLRLMLVISACWLITACGGKSPSGVTKTVYKALMKTDAPTVRKHLAKKHIATWDAIVQSGQIPALVDSKIKIVSEEIAKDGNSAKVVVERLGSKDNVNLVKENGKWKVDKRFFW
jgi:hypothetical protein